MIANKSIMIKSLLCSNCKLSAVYEWTYWILRIIPWKLRHSLITIPNPHRQDLNSVCLRACNLTQNTTFSQVKKINISFTISRKQNKIFKNYKYTANIIQLKRKWNFTCVHILHPHQRKPVRHLMRR